MMIIKGIATISLIFFVCIIFTFLFLLPYLGQWLIVEDALQESDIIVLHTGSVRDRTLQAVDIYDKNYSNSIILVNTINPSYNHIVKKGLEIPPGYAQLSKIVAIELGVPEKNILILEGNAKSTLDEAMILREYIRHNNLIQSIIIVTSKYHSRRSKKIFTKVLSMLDRKIETFSSPSNYDNFNAKMWWRNKEDISIVFWEYVKLAKFYFWDQFFLLS